MECLGLHLGSKHASTRLQQPDATGLGPARSSICGSAVAGRCSGRQQAGLLPARGLVDHQGAELNWQDQVAAWEARDDLYGGATGIVEAVQYADLAEDRGCNKPVLFRKLERAYGPSGLGILVVTRLPPIFLGLRKRLLLLAEQVAQLPDDVKLSLEDPESTWSFGYSCGKEALEDGAPDVNKVSYYANPLYNRVTSDPKARQHHPGYCRDNIWPTCSLPALEGTFMSMGQLVIEVGLMLAQRIDQYLAHKGAAVPHGRGLHDVIASSVCPKGRLLHYMPAPQAAAGEQKWCGLHTDHGSLTGLLSAMFLRDGQEVSNPDPQSGLYIHDRTGLPHRVTIPADALAFQMGEATQVLSGGLLQATPHFVRAANAPGVSRNTFAVFMQPQWDDLMDMPAGADAAKVGIGQWRPGQTFGEFAKLTMEKYAHRHPP